MERAPEQAISVYVIWEHVLTSDWAAPASPVLGRIADRRAAQFWDPTRMVSHNLGETNPQNKVWDWVAVYPPGTSWTETLPKPDYSGRPVEDVIGDFETALRAVTRSSSH